MRVLSASLLGAVVAVDAAAKGTNPTFAFTYTTETESWQKSVDSDNMNAVFVYAGDVEFYCRGSPTATAGVSPSPADLPCKFTGDSPNAFVYYNDYAKTTAAAFKKAGKQVYINFDGRITPKIMSFVPSFSKLSATAIAEFANATASHVCDDPNVDGMAWDVEPFNVDQVPFFTELDKLVTACGKKWGVFAFGEELGTEMWTTGLGKSGFLFDSTYDLDCTAKQLPPRGCLPCQCTPPDVYKTVLTQHLESVMALGKQYKKPYMLMVSGSGTTQLYEEVTTSTCSGAGGGPVYNATCPYKLSDWMQVAVDVFGAQKVASDPNFMGLGVYGYTTTNGGGFSPVVPPASTISVLNKAGYLPYAPTATDDEHESDNSADVRSLGPMPHNGNKCTNQSDITTCPMHYMLGSPMNDMV